MEDTVSDRVNLAHRLDNAVLGTHKSIGNKLDRLLMIRHPDVDLVILASLDLVLEVSALDADAVAHSLRHNVLVCHVDKLILYRRASCIDNKYFHFQPFRHFCAQMNAAKAPFPL